MQDESAWITQEDAAERNYAFYMRMDPNQREFLGPIESKYDPIFGREVKQRKAKAGLVRGTKPENMKEFTVFLEPFPHARTEHCRDLQGWYSGKNDGNDWRQRDRPCLLPEALVDTPFGPKQIQHLQVGEIVYGYNEETGARAHAVVHGVISHDKPEYLEVELVDGKILKLTPEHQVFTVNRGWIEAQELTEDDDLLGVNCWVWGKATERLTGIYALRNRRDGKMYIGSAFDGVYRARRHLKDLSGGRHNNLHLQAAWDLGDRFDVLWLENSDRDKATLVKREQFYIDYYNTLDNAYGYNLTPAGRTIITPEGRARISASKKGKTYEQIFRDKARAVSRRIELRAQTGTANSNWGNRGSLHPNFGKTNVERFGPEEASRLAAIYSKNNKGKRLSAKTRAKMSSAHKGKKLSAAHREAIRASSPNQRGFLSMLTKKKISRALKRKYASGSLPLTDKQLAARKQATFGRGL